LGFGLGLVVGTHFFRLWVWSLLVGTHFIWFCGGLGLGFGSWSAFSSFLLGFGF
jgi:hypothetical protein